jgi:hypothetical protein
MTAIALRKTLAHGRRYATDNARECGVSRGSFHGPHLLLPAGVQSGFAG